MKGIVSFHPVDVSFYDETIAPILAPLPSSGTPRTINAEPLLARAVAFGRSDVMARRTARRVHRMLMSAGPRQVDPEDSLIRRLKTRLDAYDYKPDEAVRLLAPVFDLDLHIWGRPFFILERSAVRVSERTAAFLGAADAGAVEKLIEEQLASVSPRLPQALGPADVDPADDAPLPNEHALRGALGAAIKGLIALARNPLESTIAEEFPWRAAAAHALFVPYWIARDVDGLETLCRAVGVTPPVCLVPARRLFAESIDSHAALGESLHVELSRDRDLGAFVPPGDIPELIEFLGAFGSRIIAAAAQAGEGHTATTLLQKIRECATYAGSCGYGYLEVSGIVPEGLPGPPAEPSAAVRR